MRSDVQLHINGCEVFQQMKYSTTPLAGLLQPLSIPNHIWEELTMDFIIGLPNSKGQMAILVIVDCLSKYANIGGLPIQFTAPTVTQLFLDMVMKHHGFPISIISDRDQIFLSSFWKTLFTLSGTHLKHSTTNHS